MAGPISEYSPRDLWTYLSRVHYHQPLLMADLLSDHSLRDLWSLDLLVRCESSFALMVLDNLLLSAIRGLSVRSVRFIRLCQFCLLQLKVGGLRLLTLEPI